jgi:DNA helicase-2/ATP-dependent DNA helicase PcrA
LRSEAHLLVSSNFTIYDSQDSYFWNYQRNAIDVYKPKQVLSRIPTLKNSLITVKAYFNDRDLQEADAMSKSLVWGVVPNYVDKCFKSGAMDFDDLLLKTNELLNRFPEVLGKYQNRFRYIVDEYQDTNHSQYLIVRHYQINSKIYVLLETMRIYAFEVPILTNFFRRITKGENFRLEQNYRSKKNIVEAANTVIDKNKTKLDKIVWTANDLGPKIKCIAA